MSEICAKCGLPTDLCVCEAIAKEEQKITVTIAKRRFGKLTTVISGIDEKNIDIRDISKKLKSKFACGGTSKDGTIELQGNHTDKIKTELSKLGFTEGSIVIKKLKDRKS